MGWSINRPTGLTFHKPGLSTKGYTLLTPHGEWINPFVNNNKRGEATVSIYRTHRYLPDHPALADKELDPIRFAKLNRLNGLL